MDGDTSPALRRFRSLFVNRSDTYCLQHEGGRYVRVRQALTDDVLAGHLAGDITIAVDSLGVDGMTRWGVCDADANDGLVMLAQVQHISTGWGLVTWLEQSRRGGHLWLPCATPQPAAAVRRILYAACDRVGVTVEVYPDRDVLSKGAAVSQPVRVPLGIHRVTGQRYPFVDALGRPLHRDGMGNALAWLLGQPVNHTAAIQSALHILGESVPIVAPVTAPARRSVTHSLHLPKVGGARWGVIAWVNRQPLPTVIALTRSDVALRPTHVAFNGWCPFHDDNEGDGASPSLYVWCDPEYGWHWRCLSTRCGAHQGKAKDPFDWLVWCSGGQWRIALAWGRALQEGNDDAG